MKKFALAAVLAVAGTAALASGYVVLHVEPEVVVAHSSSSIGPRFQRSRRSTLRLTMK